jgi:hypothetical protein
VATPRNQLGIDRQASSEKAAEPFPVIPVLLPRLASDAVPVGSFLSLNTWVDLRTGLDEPESLQRLVAGVQGVAIETATQKLLSGLSPYRGLLPFREQDAGLSSGASASSMSLAKRSGGARRRMSWRSSAAREAASPRLFMQA